jgi:Cupin superfamily protein
VTARGGTRARGAAALARIIDPVDVERFFSEHWERVPLVVQRDEPGRFDELLSAADVERLICSSPLRFPGFRLVKAGEQLSLRDYTRELPWRPVPFGGVPDVERILEEFEAGATIVVQALHHWWQPLTVLCRTLEAGLDQAVQANAYYTPRSAQGLAVHHDTHDVLVLQVSGEKRWLVYEPAWELPLKGQLYDRDGGSPGAPVHDVTLRGGDTLYLPRGWLHEALTSESDSLHLTIGVNVYTWLDAFRAAVERCADDLEFRRAVPTDAAGAEELLTRLGERIAPADVAARRRERLSARRRPILDGQLTQLRVAERLDLASKVMVRPTVIADVIDGDDGVTLAFDGKRVMFPVRVAEEVRYVAGAAEPFTPADLPGQLDSAGRLVLVRRLVREGMLVVVKPEQADGPSSRNGAATPP